MKTSRLALGANPCGDTHPCASASTRPAQSGRNFSHLAAILCLALIGHTATAASLNLAWNPNPEPNIASYKLGYGTSPGTYSNTLSTGTATNTTVSGLSEGQTYYFVVQAVNTVGLESAPSTEVAYQVPFSPPANQAPVASSMAVSTAKDTPLAIVLGGSDAESAALSFSIVSGPVNGVLSGSAPNLSYSPSANFSGSDSFTFLVNDGSLNSSVATVNISVTAVVPGSLVNGSFESGYAGWAVTGNAFIESASSPYTATDGVKLASLNGNSTSDSAPNAVLSQVFATTAGATYTLAFDMGVIGSASGEQKIQVTADGAGNVLSKIALKTKAAGGTAQWTPMSYTFVANSTTTVLTFRDISVVTDGLDALLDNVRVAGPPAVVNTAPVAVADSYSATTGTALVVPAAGVLINDTDAQSNPLTVALDAGPAHGSLTLSSNGGFTYTPTAGYSGSDSFTYHANDGFLNSAGATVSISVILVNTAPVASSKAVTTAEDASLAIVLEGSDAEGNPLSYRVVSGPAMGALSGTAPNLSYTPATDANGTDSFTFRVNDGKADSNIATVSINVVSANDAPTAAAQTASTPEDTALGILLSASDKDGDSLNFQIISGPAKGTLSGTAPNLTYTPNLNASGTDSFSFRASDGKANSNTATVSISISPVNDAPVAAAKTVAATAGTPVGIVLSASDADGDALTFSIVGGPAQGSLSGTPPNLTYTPNATASGSDSISFRASDGKANSNTATVSITITPPLKAANKAPVFQADFITRPAGKVNETYIATSLAGTATDPDGGAVSYSKTAGPAWLSVAPDGKISGTPPAGSEGLNSFTIRATDFNGAFDEAVLQITIEAAALALPLPWSLARIGTVPQEATAWGEAAALRIKSPGSLAGSADSGLFTWQTLSGDGEITARISALENANSSSLIGLEIRESLGSNSKHVFIGTNGNGSLRFIRRTKSGTSASVSNVGTGMPPNLWLRLTRAGTTVSAFSSVNGTTWQRIGKITISSGTSSYIGLMVCGGGANLSTGIFQNITVKP